MHRFRLKAFVYSARVNIRKVHIFYNNSYYKSSKQKLIFCRGITRKMTKTMNKDAYKERT